MKKSFYLIFLLFVLVITPLLATVNQADYLNQLVDKQKATYEDLIISFCYLKNIEPSTDYTKNIESLRHYLTKVPSYNKEKILQIGDFALLAIQHLNIKSGLFYLMTKSGRYALRELSMLGIIPEATSEYEQLSGLEFIRLLQRMDSYVESKKGL